MPAGTPPGPARDAPQDDQQTWVPSCRFERHVSSLVALEAEAADISSTPVSPEHHQHRRCLPSSLSSPSKSSVEVASRCVVFLACSFFSRTNQSAKSTLSTALASHARGYRVLLLRILITSCNNYEEGGNHETMHEAGSTRLLDFGPTRPPPG